MKHELQTDQPVAEQHARIEKAEREALIEFGTPLQNLGARLTELLDDDQWNEVEPWLLAIAASQHDAIGKFTIEVEKLLCAKLGRPWSATGISIESLADELAARASQQAAEPVAVYSEDEKERAEKLLSQIAKAYSDRIAEACDVDKGDHWQFHGDVVLEDVRFIMRTAHEILPASEPEADQAIQQPQDDLLREAAEHLRLHAEEYSHPGQHGLIARIEAALAKKGGAQ